MIKNPIYIWVICEEGDGPTETSEMFMTEEEAKANQRRWVVPTEIRTFELRETFYCDVCQQHKPERIDKKYCADCHIKECEQFGRDVMNSPAWKRLRGEQ